MHLQESGEMYLETVLILTKKIGAVRSIDVCEYMGYSKPSVSRAVGLLKNEGYLSVDKEGYLSLTSSGMEVAQKIYERHTIITKLLEKIGVAPKIAEEDACKIEHCISNETLEALKKLSENF